MPALDVIGQNLVDKPVLLDDRQARKLRRYNVERVHGAAAAADVTYLLVVTMDLASLLTRRRERGTKRRTHLQTAGLQRVLKFVEYAPLGFR